MHSLLQHAKHVNASKLPKELLSISALAMTASFAIAPFSVGSLVFVDGFKDWIVAPIEHLIDCTVCCQNKLRPQLRLLL